MKHIRRCGKLIMHRRGSDGSTAIRKKNASMPLNGRAKRNGLLQCSIWKYRGAGIYYENFRCKKLKLIIAVMIQK